MFIVLIFSTLSPALSANSPSQLVLPGVIISGRDVALTGNAKARGDIYSREGTHTSGNAQFVGLPRILTDAVPAVDFDYYREMARQEGTYHVGDLHLTDKDSLPSFVYVEGNVKLSANRAINLTIVAAGRIEVSGDSDLSPAKDRLALVAMQDIRLSGKGSVNGVVCSQRGRIELTGDRSSSGVLVAEDGVRLSGNAKASDMYPPARPTLAQPASPTNNPSLVLAGTAEAYSSVQILDGANVIAITNADGLGLYSTSAVFSEGYHTLLVIAVDTCDNVSLPSEERQVLVDTTRPTVAIVSPAEGETVRGTVTISARATDNFSLKEVELYIDSELRKTWQSPPYTYEWDTTREANGPHVILAEARDTAGNEATDTTSVEVANNVITPEGGTFTSADGEVTLEFPAGAVSETIMLFYTPLPAQPVDGFSSGSHFFSLEAYTLSGQHVTHLNKATTIRIATIGAGPTERLGLYRFKDSSARWRLVSSGFVVGDSFIATLDGLSLFALLSDTQKPSVVEPVPAGVVQSFRPLVSAKLVDAGSGIDPSSVSLKLDGGVVGAVYNAQTGVLEYRPISNLGYGKHTVDLSVADLAGNTSISTWTFVVYGTRVSGSIYQDTTWRADESPYILTGSVYVNLGATLTVEAGTVVKFTRTPSQSAPIELSVSGVLVAHGTLTEKVVFTSLLDDSYGGDTNGDGGATAPSPGDWGRIWFSGPSGSSLANAVVRYGGRPWWTYFGYAVGINSSSPLIEGSTVTDSAGHGIYTTGSSSPVIRLSVISNNLKHGVLTQVGYAPQPGPSVTTSTLSGNGGMGASLASRTAAFEHNTLKNNGDFAASLSGVLPTALETNIVSGNKRNALAVEGQLVAGNHVWSPSLGGAYVVPQAGYGGSVFVPAGTTLTIAPGTIVKFARTPSTMGPATLWVAGTLYAEGTSTDKVIFTSLLDDTHGGDTNGDGTATGPARGDWGQIRFASSSPDCRLVYAVVKYAGRRWTPQNQGAIHADSSSPLISNTVVTESEDAGIYVRGASPIIDSTNASNNGTYGVYSDVDAPPWPTGPGPTLTASTMSNNGRAGARMYRFLKTFSSNRLENNGGFAAELGGVAVSNLESNSISGNTKNALFLDSVRLAPGDHDWSPSLGGSWVVAGGLTVPTGANLTLRSGAVVKMTKSNNWAPWAPAIIGVTGSLAAEGTAAEKVVITSLQDDSYGGDTNADANATAPSPGDWGTLIFQGSQGARLEYAVVKYGGTTLTTAYPGVIYIGDCSAEIQHSTISNNKTDFNLCETGTIYVKASGMDSHINNNDISANTADYDLWYAVLPPTPERPAPPGTHALDAASNWWGRSRYPRIRGWVNTGSCAWIPFTARRADDRWGLDPQCGFFGEPVNTAIGNYTYQHKDVEMPTQGIPLSVERTYNSLDTVYTGPFGYGWTFNYNVSLRQDPDGSVLVMREDGRRDRYTSNADGSYNPPAGVTDRPTKEPDGTFNLVKKDQIKLNFSSDGRLESHEDRNGNRTALTYDADGNLTRVSDASGRNLWITCDDTGRITKIVDPLGRECSYSYDANGDLVSFTDPRGGVTRYTYADHRMTAVTDPKGQRFVQNTFDSDGRVVRQSDALGGLYAFDYDADNYRTRLTDPKGQRSTHQYDAEYRLIYETDPNGATVSYTYDAWGNRDSIRDKNGNLTRSVFDSNGNVVQIADALGNTTSMTYNEKSNLTSKRDPLGNTAFFTYDTHGNLISTTDPLGNVTTLTYNSSGDPVSVTDAPGNTTSFDYDGYGNRTKVRDPLGNATSYAYDIVGRKTATTDAKGHTTRFSYDANNNLTRVEDASGHPASYAYDANNLLTDVTDPNGHITFYQYDAMDNLTGVMDPVGNITRYTYDGDYNRSSRLDANGKTTSYMYDAANQLVGIDYPEGDDAGFAYDAQGNRTQMTDSTGTTSYAYDARNRLISTANPSGKAVSYTYDASGRRVSMTDPAGMTAYSYDAASRLTSLADPQGGVTGLEYSPAGLRTKVVYPNGVSASYSYSANNQLTTLENKKSTGETLSRFSYEYDTDGRRTTASEADGSTTTYTYDELHRLTKEGKKDAAGNVIYSFSYTYDPAGNRLSKTDKDGNVLNYAYDAANRIQSAGSATYTFDANGNMTAKSTPQGTTAYSYDAENRLAAVTLPDSSLTTFGYNGDGKRSRKATNAGATNYLYDGMSVIEETDQGGALVASYTTDPTALVGQIISRRDGSGQATYYSCDGIGAVRNLTDQAQAQVASYAYDAFGNVLSQSGTGANNRKFSTKELDQTGLYYFGARYYDPATGRFGTQDAVRPNLFYPQDLNRFVYCINDPLGLIDPTGWWYIDINVSGGYWGGLTAGLMISPSGVHPYFGGGVVSPGVGISATFSPYDPVHGWNAGVQPHAGVAGQIGYPLAKCEGFEPEDVYWEVGIGASYPHLFGFSVAGFYVW